VTPDPDTLARACARVMYADDLASRRLGIAVSDVAPGRAVTAMRVTDQMINGHALCHGGYVFLLADSALAFASNTYGERAVAAACDVSFIEPVRLGEELTATAAERHRRGRSGIYDVTVRRGDGTVVAEFRGHTRTIGGSLLADGPAG
jgi:acyl-CoA thioesterase